MNLTKSRTQQMTQLRAKMRVMNKIGRKTQRPTRYFLDNSFCHSFPYWRDSPQHEVLIEHCGRRYVTVTVISCLQWRIFIKRKSLIVLCHFGWQLHKQYDISMPCLQVHTEGTDSTAPSATPGEFLTLTDN